MNNNFQIFQYDGSQYNQLIPNSSNTATNSTQLGGVESNLYATKEYVDTVAPKTPYNSAYEGWTKIGTITFNPNESTTYIEKTFPNIPEYMNFCMLEVTGGWQDSVYWGQSPNSSFSYFSVKIEISQNKKARYISPCIYNEKYYAIAPQELKSGAQNRMVPVLADTISAINLQYNKETVFCTLYYR